MNLFEVDISWFVGQVVKTLPFHGSNMGSNPIRTIKSIGLTGLMLTIVTC